MEITPQCVVALTWTLKDSLGDTLDELEEPVEFLVGSDDLLRSAMRMACRDAVGTLRPAQVAEDFDRILHSLARNGGRHVATAATP